MGQVLLLVCKSFQLRATAFQVLYSVFFDSVLLKELRHDIVSHFFDSLNYGLRVAKPKNNG